MGNMIYIFEPYSANNVNRLAIANSLMSAYGVHCWYGNEVYLLIAIFHSGSSPEKHQEDIGTSKVNCILET